MRRGALVLLAAVLAGGLARATADPPRADARAEYRRAMARAADLLEGARRSAPPRRDRLVAEAVQEYERAARLMPEEPDPHYLLGLVYADFLHDPRRAITAWYRVRAIDPAFLHDPDMAFKLGVELSRLGEFERGIAEYDRCLGYRMELTRVDVVLGNSAEAAMGAGLLDEAIRRYRRALAAPPYDAAATALHLFGLAVALDRDEQTNAAREVLQRALALDPGRSSMEPERGVFFVPEGDRHFYDGLALELSGHVAEAREAFEHYLAALPGARYAARARAHLRALARDRRARPTATATATAVGLRVSPPLAAPVVGRWLLVRVAELASCPAPPGAATVEVRARVGARGQPVELSVTGARLDLVSCTRGRVAAWRFPSPGGPGTAAVTFTLVFTPSTRP